MFGRERGMHCVGSVFVLLGTSHPGFLFPCMCVDLCSVAGVCHHDFFWLLLCFIRYKSPRFFYFHACVLLCSQRFDGTGGDCTAGRVHSDLPKGHSSSLDGNALPRRCANIFSKTHLCRFDVPVHKLMGRCRQVL